MVQFSSEILKITNKNQLSEVKSQFCWFGPVNAEHNNYRSSLIFSESVTVTDISSVWSFWSRYSFNVQSDGEDERVSLKQEAEIRNDHEQILTAVEHEWRRMWTWLLTFGPRRPGSPWNTWTQLALASQRVLA